MKRLLIYIITLVMATIVASAQDYETDFRELQQQFEERLKTTPSNLKAYMASYPYSTYTDEIYFMEGVLYAEKGKYKQAIKAFSKVNAKNLSRESQPMLYFYWGYTLVKQNNYQQALSQLLKLKNQNSLYTPHARYYAGYCYYCMKEFPRALAEFLAVEQLSGYQQIVPYYIIQIDYAQGEYEKVYERANHLLNAFPENQNNYELHRMLGEMYYQDSLYDQSIEHLTTYQTLIKEQKKEPLRGDIYIRCSQLSNREIPRCGAATQKRKRAKRLHLRKCLPAPRS